MTDTELLAASNIAGHIAAKLLTVDAMGKWGLKTGTDDIAQLAIELVRAIKEVDIADADVEDDEAITDISRRYQKVAMREKYRGTNRSLKAKFTNFNSGTHWVKGICGGYTFSAKLYDEDSSFGIDGGRVSKLEVSRHPYHFPNSLIVNYDRGWDIGEERKTEEEEKVFVAIMELLESSPKRFEEC